VAVLYYLLLVFFVQVVSIVRFMIDLPFFILFSTRCILFTSMPTATSMFGLVLLLLLLDTPGPLGVELQVSASLSPPGSFACESTSSEEVTSYSGDDHPHEELTEDPSMYIEIMNETPKAH
jgi:hypothetical protein